MLYVPTVEDESVSVDVPVPPDANATVAGLSDAVKPDDGETDVERFTVPPNPFRLPRLMVDDPEPPVENETLVGLVDSEKSPTPTVTVAECERDALVPVKVTV